MFTYMVNLVLNSMSSCCQCLCDRVYIALPLLKQPFYLVAEQSGFCGARALGNDQRKGHRGVAPARGDPDAGIGNHQRPASQRLLRGYCRRELTLRQGQDALTPKSAIPKRHWSVQRRDHPYNQIVEGHFLVVSYHDPHSSFCVGIVKELNDKSPVDGCFYPAIFNKNT